MSTDEHPPWSQIRARLRRAVPDSTWHQWLEPLSGRQSDDGTLLIEAPPQMRPWVAKRYGRLLHRCATAFLGPVATVEVVAAGVLAPARWLPRYRPDTAGLADALNLRHTIVQYVIGDT